MKLKLVSSQEEAKDTKTFFFEPDSKVSFIAGQYYYVTLPSLDFEDERGTTRHFTLSGSPSEKLLRITTRIRKESGYKKTLAGLPDGESLEGKGPNGTFTLENIKKGPYVFIAGGIGITPFRSIFKDLVDKKDFTKKFYLMYSNSDKEYVFKKEIDEWVKNYDSLKVRYNDTSSEGRLDAKKVEDLIGTWNISTKDSSFLVSGPPQFVSALEMILHELEIPSENIHTDKFTGY